MSGENSRLFVISPCFYLFINFGFVFCLFVFVFVFLQVRCGCKVGESLERTNNEISQETRAMNKECTKTTSALSFFFFFFWCKISHLRICYILSTGKRKQKREWPTSNNNTCNNNKNN